MIQGLNYFCITHKNDYYLLTRRSFATITDALKEAKKECDTIKKEVYVYKKTNSGYIEMATVEYQANDVLFPYFLQSKEEMIMRQNSKLELS